MLATPLFLKTKQTLKTLCYEYNGFEGLSYDNLSTLSILGITIPTDDVYQIMLFSVCDNYWYDEIGFDIDEIFIERFNNTWIRYSGQYHQALVAYLNNNGYEIKTTGTTTETNTGGTTSTKSGTDTNINTGTIVNEGQRQDYQVQTQDSSNTQTNDLTNATTYGAKVENTQDTTKTNTKEYVVTDLSPDRLREIIGSVGLLDAFVDCFRKLFMQVIVR